MLANVPFAILNGSGDYIQGNVRYCDDGRMKPVIIICHSFMAFKEWGFFPYVAAELASRGFVSVVFNFSHNGVAAADVKITDFVKFSDNTFSKELLDVDALINAVIERKIANGIGDGNRIGLLGHSRGGGIAIIQSASDSRIRALVTWSAVAYFDRWTSHQKELWKRRGFLPLAADSHVSPLKLGLDLLEDVEQNQEKLNILNAASRVNVPWLVIHGSADITVKPHEAELLYAASGKPLTTLRVLEHVGHLYRASSPEEDHYATLNKILQSTGEWFSRHLLEE